MGSGRSKCQGYGVLQQQEEREVGNSRGRGVCNLGGREVGSSRGRGVGNSQECEAGNIRGLYGR